MAFGGYGFRPYVPVAVRRQAAAQHATRASRSGVRMEPVVVEGRTIANSWWGKAWCDNLECYSDFASRLPRGRTYARNGSVFDLKIGAGAVTALVSGSEIYTVTVTIQKLAAARWRTLVAECSGHIGSVLDLLQGRFSATVMQRLARRDTGLFPTPNEIGFECSCPDIASMCKHIAAVLYGVGARLDRQPELFFALRQVDSADLIAAAAAGEGLVAAAGGTTTATTLANGDLGQVFGIELDATPVTPPTPRGSEPRPRTAGSPAARATARKRARQPVGDGFEEVFGPGCEVTPALLLGFGVPRTTFANWLTTGVLVRTDKRSVYRATATTLERFRRVQRRNDTAR